MRLHVEGRVVNLADGTKAIYVALQVRVCVQKVRLRRAAGEAQRLGEVEQAVGAEGVELGVVRVLLRVPHHLLVDGEPAQIDAVEVHIITVCEVDRAENVIDVDVELLVVHGVPVEGAVGADHRIGGVRRPGLQVAGGLRLRRVPLRLEVRAVRCRRRLRAIGEHELVLGGGVADPDLRAVHPPLESVDLAARHGARAPALARVVRVRREAREGVLLRRRVISDPGDVCEEGLVRQELGEEDLEHFQRRVVEVAEPEVPHGARPERRDLAREAHRVVVDVAGEVPLRARAQDGLVERLPAVRRVQEADERRLDSLRQGSAVDGVDDGLVDGRAAGLQQVARAGGGEVGLHDCVRHVVRPREASVLIEQVDVLLRKRDNLIP
mmetsp:Transcript_42726/g.133905  ORF Transcript_42726/g.133905 Transcript_42726/m.133905 type:complete len:381 (-) Transcript_42726:1075-2217(-)